MKVSLKWLSDYIDIDIPVQTLANIMTGFGLEIEGIYNIEADTIFDIDIPPQRPDLLGVIGIARELGIFLNKELHIPQFSLKEGEEPIENKINVKILDNELCKRYSIGMIRGIEPGESPNWLKERIEPCGIGARNSVVDTTNYVMFELGHPVHAFDYDKLKEKEIIIRRAKDGEEIVTLDGVSRKLSRDILIICDGEEPIAIAGIMGGENSKIDENTKNVVVESAYFDPVCIRKARRILNLQTEASYRFERNADIEITPNALRRALFLIKETSGGELAKTIMDLYSHPIKERRINFEVENINRILGSELGYKEIEECFEKMGFSVTGNSVLIPSFRRDVNGEIDLVEEVARFRGYGSFPVERPIRRVEESDMVSVLRKTLSALGFNEAYSLSFMNPRHNFSPERIPIQLQNPINKELSVLRTSLLPGLLQIAETNISRGVRDIRLYELGTIFTLQNEKVIEKKLLSGILTGKREPQELYCKEDVGFSDVKGIVESFLEAIEIEKLSFFSLSSPLFSSGTGCGINIDSTYIGQLGEVRTDISREFGIERPYFFELEIKKLISHKRYRKLFTSLARFPSISRDISLIIDNELISSSLVKSVKEEGIRWLEDVKIFDYYSGDKIPREKKALGIRMVFRSPDRTLTSYEVDEEVKRIVENLQEKYGVFERHI